MRECSNCNSPMTSGYCIHDGEEYFCSDDCLCGWYQEEEYAELYENEEAYWTDWEDTQDDGDATEERSGLSAILIDYGIGFVASIVAVRIITWCFGGGFSWWLVIGAWVTSSYIKALVDHNKSCK